MIGFCPLASGSKGNCIYFGTKHTKILIDAGIGIRTIKSRLEEIDVSINEIDAVLVTHEHSDHIRGLASIAEMNIPILANHDTANGIYEQFLEMFRFKIFTTGETFEFHDLQIHPFSIQHDAMDPVAFTIKTERYKFGFCADLGFATTLVEHQLKNCDYLYLESNHQPSMVHACARPMVYKQRVLSRQGHLSNEQCGLLLSKVHHENLKHVHLAHLSSECNSPEKALEVVNTILRQAGQIVPLSIAPQESRAKAICLTDPECLIVKDLIAV
ncbi:MAG: Metallo-beta-lactamase superfamily protein [Chlamydiales bacterium]|jgi:phosphoribosyl 1,2-cyclic phosphodiesterase|nr:Metallo-beta-lactamase superfamily protein [Chlamydiales bacterium]